MLNALFLIVAGALARVVPHPPNAVAMGALALYAGARWPRRSAWLVPVAAMALSDLMLDFGTGRPFVNAVRLTSYATFALIAALGALPRRDAGPAVRGAASLGASLLFFATTNLAVWAAGKGAWYPLTPACLAACYVAALPFLGNTVAADLFGTVALFGLEPAAWGARGKAKAKVAGPDPA